MYMDTLAYNVSCTKTVDPIDMGPTDHVLEGGRDSPHGKGPFERVSAS